jgi:16S rRNA (cytosine967-C5)-methyltransferase
LISPARRSAYEVLCEVLLRGAFSDQALSSGKLSALEARDRNLVTEITYGTLRWLARLDSMLIPVSSRPWRSVDERLKILLRMSAYQIWRMERVPDYAVVNDAVEISKQLLGNRMAPFVNGVLRQLSRDRGRSKPKEQEGIAAWTKASLPRFLWERWKIRYGETAAMEYAMSLNEPPRTAIRYRGAGLPEDHQSIGIVPSNCVPGAFLLPSSMNFEKRYQEILRIQDEASQLIPQLLGTLRGGWIWDACAAPGGKSAILQEMCDESSTLVSSDIDYDRALFLKNVSLRYAGCRSNVLVADALLPPPFRSHFDAVLADVPCSGLGTLRRNPEIKWRFRPDRFKILAEKQSKILSSISDAVRPGGYLLYSTCSTEPEENENVIWRFLATRRDYQLQKPAAPAGVDRWLDEDGMLRTFPCDRLWDGFFAALMVRNA